MSTGQGRITAGSPVLVELAFDPKLAERLGRGRGMRHAATEFVRTIGALIQREAVTRFGRTKLGYAWALIEPVAFLLLFVGIRSFVRDRVPFGDSVAVFLLTGILAARAALALAGSISRSITSNRSMLTYPLVQPLDTVIAKAILDVLTWIMVIAIIMFGMIVLLQADVSLNFPGLTAAILVTLTFGVCWGMLNASLYALLGFWPSVMGAIRLPMFITSGAFWLPIVLPPKAIAIVSWNPLLHCVEWMRNSLYLDYVPVLDRAYPLEVSAVMLATALTLERVFRRQIAAR